MIMATEYPAKDIKPGDRINVRLQCGYWRATVVNNTTNVAEYARRLGHDGGAYAAYFERIIIVDDVYPDRSCEYVIWCKPGSVVRLAAPLLEKVG